MTIETSPFDDAVSIAFRRMRKEMRLARLNNDAGDWLTADRHMAAAHAACSDMETLPPSTRRGVVLKAISAYRFLDRMGDYQEAAQRVHAFFRTPVTLTDEWLDELRMLIAAVEQETGKDYQAVTFLRQTLHGISGTGLACHYGFIDDEEEEDEGPDLPPISTAARITSLAEMQEVIKRDWS